MYINIYNLLSLCPLPLRHRGDSFQCILSFLLIIISPSKEVLALSKLESPLSKRIGLLDETVVTEVPCHNRFGTIKIPHSVPLKVSWVVCEGLCSPSTAIMTSNISFRTIYKTRPGEIYISYCIPASLFASVSGSLLCLIKVCSVLLKHIGLS